MKRFALYISLAAIGFYWACACDEDASSFETSTGSDITIDSNANDTGSGTTDGEDSDGCSPISTLVLDEEHNYEFQSSIKIKSYPLAQYPSVPVIDWSRLTHDLIGHPVDPVDGIGHIDLIVWNNVTHEQFQEWLNTDSLNMEHLAGSVSASREQLGEGTTSVHLSELTSFGMDVDAEKFFDSNGEFPSSENIFVILLGSGSAIGGGAKMVAFLEPVESPTAATKLDVTGDSITLDYEANLTGAQRYTVPINTADIIVDWRQMDGKTNAMGLPWRPNQVQQVLVAHYPDKSPADLEAQFLDLEIMTDEMYTFEPPTVQPVSLSSLVDAEGNLFTGITNGPGTWILALQCTMNCNNPAPKYLTILEPCEAGF